MSRRDDEASTMLRCVGVTKRYAPSDAGAHDVSLEAREGQILSLVGPSGCGKTTLLRLIAGLETAETGMIEIDGAPVTTRSVFVPPENRGVGFVFQDYALFPHMTVAANIGYGLPRHASNRAARIDELLTLVNLTHLRNRRPHDLSGGERQRVALARALAPAPKILLLDEPFSNLDPTLSARLQVEVREILRAAGITAIFVTHDQRAALSMGDVIAVMNEGRIQQVGTPDDVFHDPATRFVATFLGEADFIPAERSPGTSYVMTELGEAQASGVSAWGSETALDLMLRPDDLEMRADESGNGRVVGRAFSGAAYSYHVELRSGRLCHAITPHTHAIEIGARVSLRIRAGHPLPVFPRETARPL